MNPSDIEPEEAAQIVREIKRFDALRQVCRASHKGGAGGAAMCICGAGGGGSDACAALGRLQNLVTHIPTDKLPLPWKKEVEALRNLMWR